MNGQTKNFKKEIVDDYLDRVNPYELPKPISFDLRAYSAYITKYDIKPKDITPEIMKQFSKA